MPDERLQPRGTLRPAAALNGVVPHRRVVVGQLFAGPDATRGTDPDGRAGHLEPAVGPAGVVDEAGDVAADRRVTAPRAIDPEDPDAALFEVARLARRAVAVANHLAGVIDDPRVLRDRLGREHAVPVQLRAAANDPGKWLRGARHHATCETPT